MSASRSELPDLLAEVRRWRSADWDDDAMGALDAASHLLRRAENMLGRELRRVMDTEHPAIVAGLKATAEDDRDYWRERCLVAERNYAGELARAERIRADRDEFAPDSIETEQSQPNSVAYWRTRARDAEIARDTYRSRAETAEYTLQAQREGAKARPVPPSAGFNP